MFLTALVCYYFCFSAVVLDSFMFLTASCSSVFYNTVLSQYLLLQEKITLKDPIVEAVKYLLVRGWSLNKLSPLDSHNIPIKAKMVCIRRPFRPKRKLKPEEEYRFYEPEVMDLSRVDIRSEIRVCVRNYESLIVLKYCW